MSWVCGTWGGGGQTVLLALLKPYSLGEFAHSMRTAPVIGVTLLEPASQPPTSQNPHVRGLLANVTKQYTIAVPWLGTCPPNFTPGSKKKNYTLSKGWGSNKAVLPHNTKHLSANSRPSACMSP